MSTGLRLVLRFVGFVAGLAIGAQTGALVTLGADSGDTGGTIFLIALSIGGIGYVIGPHVSRAIVRNVRQTIRETSLVDLIAVAAGLLLGGILAALLAVPLSYLPGSAGSILPFAVAVVLCGLSVGVMLLRKRELITPFIRQPPPPPLPPPAPNIAATMPLVVDTNILIDGRLAELFETGFLAGRVIVPRFILDEVQLVADSSDPLRRQRGQRGLESLAKVQEIDPTLVEILDVPPGVAVAPAVDAKLVDIAKYLNARILTNDANLQRVAQIQGVTVLNLNNLGRALRPSVLPGEGLNLRLIQEGREGGQAIGYLDDGTMVVVDGGRRLIGKTVDVTVTRMLQTGSGRMVFAVPVNVPA
ncbi:MAG: TRAM domain-containing protein [Chloroflexia bacterium]|nr:TRAM domain-containing protein [Chloroflexia bacterium]